MRAAGSVFAEREAALIEATFVGAFDRERAVTRREAGEPLEYVVGSALFAGVKVAIGPPAFIPRLRAEALVDAAEAAVTEVTSTTAVRARSDPVTALDLGCGAGAIAAALAVRHRDWDIHACDIDRAALTWAMRNAKQFGFSVHEGSWFAALPAALAGSLDLVVAHLPYVPTAEITHLPRDFREHEARHAVDGGTDGLDPLRTVVAACEEWLASDGVLVTQLAHEQLDSSSRIAADAGLCAAIMPPPHGDEDEDTVVLGLRRRTDAARPAGRD